MIIRDDFIQMVVNSDGFNGDDWKNEFIKFLKNNGQSNAYVVTNDLSQKSHILIQDNGKYLERKEIKDFERFLDNCELNANEIACLYDGTNESGYVYYVNEYGEKHLAMASDFFARESGRYIFVME